MKAALAAAQLAAAGILSQPVLLPWSKGKALVKLSCFVISQGCCWDKITSSPFAKNFQALGRLGAANSSFPRPSWVLPLLVHVHLPAPSGNWMNLTSLPPRNRFMLKIARSTRGRLSRAVIAEPRCPLSCQPHLLDLVRAFTPPPLTCRHTWSTEREQPWSEAGFWPHRPAQGEERCRAFPLLSFKRGYSYCG